MGVAAATGVVAFIVYCFTLAQGVGVDDSGELMAAACEPGIVHPPGYPLLTLISHAMVRIPWGDVGVRLNLISALFGACTTWLISRAVAQVTHSAAAAVIAACAWSFAPAVWSWSTLTEVFALNNCLIAAMINLNIEMDKAQSPRLITTWMLLAGLALCNQLTVLFWLPVGGVWLVVANYRLLQQPKVIAWGLCALLLGLLPYLYLPIATLWRPEVRWGDPTSIIGFIKHISRAEFGALQMAQTDVQSGQLFLTNLWLYLKAQSMSLSGIGWLIIFAMTLWLTISRRWRAAPLAVGFLSVAWLFYALVFHYLANVDVKNALYERMLSRFWLQPHLYLAILLGISWSWWHKTGPSRWRWFTQLSAVGLIGFAVYNGQKHRVADASDYYSAVGQAVLKPLPNDSLIITQGDFHYNILAYLKHCLKVRTDIHIVRQEIIPAHWSRDYLSQRTTPLVRAEQGQNPSYPSDVSLNEILEFNGVQRPIYLADDHWFIANDKLKNFDLIPAPLLYRVSPKLSNQTITTLIPQWEDDFQSLIKTTFAANKHMEKDLWTEKITDTIWVSRANFGQFLLELGRDRSRSSTEQNLALKYAGIALEQVAQHWPQIAGGFWKNLGLYYFLFQKTNPDYRHRALAAWEQYMSQDQGRDPDTAELARLVTMLRESSGK